MSDDRIDVSIGVTSDRAEAGAQQAAKAMTNAVAGIQQQLDKLVSTSQTSASAMASGFDRMSQAVAQSASTIGTALKANATIVDDFGNEVVGVSRRVAQANAEEAVSHERVGHAAAGARREMLVIAHELFTGNFKRAAGSVMVLGERMDWLGKIMSPTGAAIGIVIGAIAAVAVAVAHGASEMSAFRESMVLTGNYAGITAGQFIDMGDAIATTTGSKISVARDALAQVAASGRFTGQALQPVAEAIARISDVSGKSAEDVTKSFEKMDEGVYKWANNFNAQYHFANMAQMEHIRLLEETGQKDEAEAYAAQLVLGKINETANQLGYLPGLWHEVKNAASEAWDAMMNWGRPVTIESRIKELKDRIAAGGTTNSEGIVVGGDDADKAALRKLEQQRDQEQGGKQLAAQMQETQEKGTKAVEALRGEFKGLGGSVELANEAVDRFRQKITDAKKAAEEGGTPLPKDIQSMVDKQAEIEANIRKQYDRGDSKKPKGQVTLGNESSQAGAQANADLAVLREKLKEQQDQLDRSYKLGATTLQSYYAQRLQITTTGMDAEIAAVRNQLAQTEALEARASTPAERISMKTKEIELTGRLTAMEMQRADAVRKSGQEEQQALAEQQKATDEQLKQETDTVATETRKRAVMSAQEEVRQGQITKAQLIQQEMQYQNELTQTEIQALQQRLDRETQLTLAQKTALYAQIVQLDQRNQTQQMQLAQEAAQAQMQAAENESQSIQDGFARAFANFADGTQTARQAFTQFINQVDSSLTQMVSKDLFNKLFNMDVGGEGSVNGMLTGLLGKLTGGTQASGQAAHTAAVTADTTGLTVMTASVNAATAALAAMAQAAAANATAGGSGGGGGLLGSLLGALGGGSEAGAFGFTATGITGSASAVADGAMSSGTDGMAALMGLASFDVGTPYVPNDMIAQIHQGEAIVPAHMNRPGYNPGTMSVTNHFNLPGGTDMRTQSQIASMAGGAIQTALRRNG